MEFEYPFYATSTLLPEGLSTDDYRHEFYKNNRYMGIEQTYTVGGGTAGTQPTFTGDPLFSGHYVILAALFILMCRLILTTFLLLVRASIM